MHVSKESWDKEPDNIIESSNHESTENQNKQEEQNTKNDEEKSKEDEDKLKARGKIMKSENSHVKFYCLFLVIVIIVLNLIKGSSGMKSIVGIQLWSPFDYSIFALQILF